MVITYIENVNFHIQCVDIHVQCIIPSFLLLCVWGDVYNYVLHNLPDSSKGMVVHVHVVHEWSQLHSMYIHDHNFLGCEHHSMYIHDHNFLGCEHHSMYIHDHNSLGCEQPYYITQA